MVAIAKSGTPSLSTLGPIPGANKLPTLTAGENIAAGDACYIKGDDGKVWRSDGSATDEESAVHGFAPYAVNEGETITLFHQVTFRYGASLTPGARVFLGTSGALSTTATTGGRTPIGFCVDTERIYFYQSRYIPVVE